MIVHLSFNTSRAGPGSGEFLALCEALAEGLKHNSTLTYLVLQDNNIGPEGAQAWCLERMARILRNES